jgi:hypothetical protein
LALFAPLRFDRFFTQPNGRILTTATKGFAPPLLDISILFLYIDGKIFLFFRFALV